jgi:hypothetical protein
MQPVTNIGFFYDVPNQIIRGVSNLLLNKTVRAFNHQFVLVAPCDVHLDHRKL